MWTVIKFDKRNLSTLKSDFFKKLGCDVKFYIPKIKLKKFIKKKTVCNEKLILEDYLFCFHKKFSKKSVITSLKYCKGLKYILSDFLSSQIEIEKFISKCKENEDEEGFIQPTFFDFMNKKNYEFISGPFTNMMFNIISQNKLFIRAFIGNYRITVSKGDNLIRPV